MEEQGPGFGRVLARRSHADACPGGGECEVGLVVECWLTRGPVCPRPVVSLLRAPNRSHPSGRTTSTGSFVKQVDGARPRASARRKCINRRMRTESNQPGTTRPPRSSEARPASRAVGLPGKRGLSWQAVACPSRTAHPRGRGVAALLSVASAPITFCSHACSSSATLTIRRRAHSATSRRDPIAVTSPITA